MLAKFLEAYSKSLRATCYQGACRGATLYQKSHPERTIDIQAVAAEVAAEYLGITTEVWSRLCGREHKPTYIFQAVGWESAKIAERKIAPAMSVPIAQHVTDDIVVDFSDGTVTINGLAYSLSDVSFVGPSGALIGTKLMTHAAKTVEAWRKSV